MYRLRFAIQVLTLLLIVFVAAEHPQVAGALLLAVLLQAADSLLALRALRAVKEAAKAMAEDHLEALVVAAQVRALATGATREEAIRALDIMEANPGMAKGLAKAITDMAAKVMAAKEANGE